MKGVIDGESARRFLDLAGVLFVVLDTTGRLTFINEYGLHLLGYEAEEVLGKDWFDTFVPNTSREELRSVFARLVSGGNGSLQDYDNTIVAKNGEKRTFAWHNTLLRDKDGVIRETISSGTDISNRVEIEKTLRESENNYRRIFTEAADAIFVFALSGTIVAANPSAHKISGYEQGELVGLSGADIIHPDYYHGLANFRRHIEQSGTFFSRSVNVRRNGTPYDVAVHGAQFTLHGEPHLLAIVRDISAQVQAEKEIVRAREEWEKTFKSIPDYISVIDTEFRIKRLNQRMADKLGYKAEDLLGTHCYQCVHGMDHPPEFCPNLRLLEDNKEHLATAFEERLGGNVLISVSPLYDEQGELIGSIHVARDINEQVKVGDRIRESAQKLERLHDAANHLEMCDNEDELCKLTVEAAQDILEFSMCTVDIVQGEKLVVKAISADLPPEHSRETSLSEENLATKTLRMGTTTIFGSLDEVTDAKPTDVSFQSGISAPIRKYGVFQAVSTEENAFIDEDVRLLELLLGHTSQAIERVRLQEQLREQATRDPLTNVYNRRYFNQAIEQEIGRSKRYDHPIGFLMIDIDKFKEINDRYGHQVGDKVLQEMAKLLQEQVRESDVVVRYGGDEFLLLLIETDGETETVQERILEEVTQRNKINLIFDFPVTLSIGSAHWSPGDERTVEEILAEADDKMYVEKQRHAEES
jgi:diguanylate cyclase (GGDEF)-like protein/PAS domain S-box-containing protein